MNTKESFSSPFILQLHILISLVQKILQCSLKAIYIFPTWWHSFMLKRLDWFMQLIFQIICFIFNLNMLALTWKWWLCQFTDIVISYLSSSWTMSLLCCCCYFSDIDKVESKQLHMHAYNKRKVLWKVACSANGQFTIKQNLISLIQIVSCQIISSFSRKK